MNTSNQPPEPQRSGTAQTIMIVTAVVGGVALLGVGASSAIGMIMPSPLSSIGFSSNDFVEDQFGFDPDEWGDWDDAGDRAERRDEARERDGAVSRATESGELEVPVDGITSLEIDVAGAAFTLEFADVDEAQLAVEYTDAQRRGGEWLLRVDDDEELVVERAGGSRFALPGGRDTVTLTLPQHLGEDRVLEADITLNGGELRGTGDFSSLDLDVNAGYLSFAGGAQDFDLDVRAGQADVEIADAVTASIEVEAGAASAVFTGAAPGSVEVEASAGRVDVQLPEEEYRLDARGEAGRIDSDLATNEESEFEVKVRSSLGEVTLR